MSPLDFFLKMMRNPEAPVHLRTKAARIAAPFVHPKPASRKPSLAINDPYGFVIDLEAAREVRDEYRRHFRFFQTLHMRSRDDTQHWVALQRYQELNWSLGQSTECPTCYTSEDEHEDLERRDELFRKWKGRQPPHQLTPEEDAEEAHLYGRIAAFKQESCRAGRRMDVLRNLGEKRSAAEQSELDALEARHRRIPPKNGSFWLVDY